MLKKFNDLQVKVKDLTSDLVKEEEAKKETLITIETLKEALKTEFKNSEQLKKALKVIDEHIENLNTNSIEENSKLESDIKELESKVEKFVNKVAPLENQIQNLTKENANKKTLSVQLTETRDKNYKLFTEAVLKHKVLDTQIIDCKNNTIELQNQINYLEAKVDDLKQREKAYIDIEENNAADFTEFESRNFETIKLIDEIGELKDSFDLGDKSIQAEIDCENVRKISKLEDIIEKLTTQTNEQSIIISNLQKRNLKLKKNRRVSIANMNFDNDGASTSRKVSQTTRTDVDKTALEAVTKSLGELMSREDKKSIPIFKGKSTDKLITKWLRDAEHVARNNDWDDLQKIRFFSDRLEGIALDWHEKFIESFIESENDLDLGDIPYIDWKNALIQRFRDQYDIANLKDAFKVIKQKSNENCKAFISRVESSYNDFEDKIDFEIQNQNKTVLENTLQEKITKMRDEVKVKALIKGLSKLVKKELYLNMPPDLTDWENVCKRVLDAEQALRNKETTEDTEITAVIAGITHHEKEQDDELIQQKKDIGSLKQKLAELELSNKKDDSSQENIAIIGAADHYEPRRSGQSDRRFSRPDSRVRFGRSEQTSRDSSYNRSRENSYPRGRDSSNPRNSGFSPARSRDNSFSREPRTPYPRQFYPQQQQQRFSQNRFGNQQQRQNFNPRFSNFRPNNFNQFNSYPRNFNNPRPQKQWIDHRNHNPAHQQVHQHQQPNQQPVKRDIICHKCHNPGHIARECWTDMARLNQRHQHHE